MTQLEDYVKKYSRKFKQSSIFIPGSDDNPMRETDVIPTGSLLIDRALGIGGYPRGFLTEIFGPAGTGKSTLAETAVREAQKKGLWGIYLDFEHALDLNYMQNLGVDLHKVIIAQPDSGEDGFQLVEDLLNEADEDFGIIVLDSIAAINTRQERGSDIGDQHVGLTARLINKADRKLTPLIARKNVALLFINQLRANIGGYGLSETTTGGKSIPYFAAVRMRVAPNGYVDKSGDRVGIKSRVDVVKNKRAAPYKRAEIQILFGEGIDRGNEVVNFLIERGKLIQAGSWIKLDEDTTLGQGANNTYDEHSEMLEEMVLEEIQNE